MKHSHTAKILLFTLILGLIIDIAWVKQVANKNTDNSISYLVESIEFTLEQVEAQLTQLDHHSLPCSTENRQKLEDIIFNSSVIQEITYIENDRFICSDRDHNNQQAIDNKHLKLTDNSSDYIIYRATSERRNVEGIFFMVPANNGWYQVLFNARYMDFWIDELADHHQVFACFKSNNDNALYNCENKSSKHIVYSASKQSAKYPFHAVGGYTNQIFFKIWFKQLPYAALIIISLSCIVTLTVHAYFNWRHSLLNDIQRGIERKEFIAYYQPIVDANTNHWHGAELLVRWNHPKSGIITPAEFIPAAEQSGQINQITLQLLERAAYEKSTINELAPNSYISVNVTASMITNTDYVESLIGLIKQYPVLQNNVVLEFTERETFATAELGLLLSGMERLREVGVRWALDDFGTGYAGLSTLQTLSFDILKIDRTFVASSVTDAITHSILGNIAEMGLELNCTLVAEGVETAEEAEHVAQLGIQRCQGFYYAQPMPYTDYFAALKKRIKTSNTHLSELNENLGIPL
ncbi:Sensory box/GGDEF family protein [Photobacterium marinum]|uniref:cyclic-guanylate-specific phosphodiesterase n=1 Tax=Photobacterium marinum TaxID=1056511 RepID=L8JG42_9GAMM|nr:EAL domain-containing protein [Photobacterium marinum]ELR67775.1 Sensory box/GGDEF family protein [Photobacterium marinum]